MSDKKPQKWTGKLIGKMHNEEMTYAELAKELGITKEYVCMILNGHRNPEGIRAKMEDAFDAIVERRKAEVSDAEN